MTTNTDAGASAEHQDKKDKMHRRTVGGLSLHNNSPKKKSRKVRQTQKHGKKQINSIEVNKANILPSRVRTRNKSGRGETFRINWNK